jgi:hypothetical protein
MPARIVIDIAEVKRLAGLGLSEENIAISLGISQDTLTRRKKDFAEFAEALKSGKVAAQTVVADKLYELCKEGNLGAIIWYEKTRLGYSEKITNEHSGPNGGPIPFKEIIVQIPKRPDEPVDD